MDLPKLKSYLKNSYLEDRKLIRDDSLRVEDNEYEITIPIHDDICHVLLSNLTRLTQKRSEELQYYTEKLISENISVQLINQRVTSEYFKEHYVYLADSLFGLNGKHNFKIKQEIVRLIITDSPMSTHIDGNSINCHKPEILFVVSPLPQRAKLALTIYVKYDKNKKLGFIVGDSPIYIQIELKEVVIRGTREKLYTEKEEEFLTTLEIYQRFGALDIKKNMIVSDQHSHKFSEVSESITFDPEANHEYYDSLKSINPRIQQYRDFLGNRTLSGYRITNNEAENIILLGGSTAACNELPHETTIENCLRKMLKPYEVSSLACAGTCIDSEFAHLFHWIIHRKNTTHVVSLSLLNDFLTGITRKKRSNNGMKYDLFSLGRTRAKNDYVTENLDQIIASYDDETLQEYLIKYIRSIDALAGAHNFHYYYIIQPIQIKDDKQMKLYNSSKLDLITPYSSPADKHVLKRLEAYDNFKNSMIRRISRIKLANTTVLDSSELFTDDSQQLYCDMVHFNKHGSLRMAQIITSLIQQNK